jgi:hypothetical protein
MSTEDFQPWKTLKPRLDALVEKIERQDAAAVRALLIALVPGYCAGALTDFVCSEGGSTGEGVVPLRSPKSKAVRARVAS